MTLPDLDRPLAAMVTERPELAPVFDALGLDYCCGGDRRLGEAIDAADLDVDAVRARLEAAPRPPAEAIEWADFGMVEMDRDGMRQLFDFAYESTRDGSYDWQRKPAVLDPSEVIE